MDDKNTVTKLIKQIENTRTQMQSLISEKQYDLLDLDVIKLSQVLDELLSKYHYLKQ